MRKVSIFYKSIEGSLGYVALLRGQGVRLDPYVLIALNKFRKVELVKKR